MKVNLSVKSCTRALQNCSAQTLMRAFRFEKSSPGGMTFMTGMWRPTRRRARSTGSNFLSYLQRAEQGFHGIGLGAHFLPVLTGQGAGHDAMRFAASSCRALHNKRTLPCSCDRTHAAAGTFKPECLQQMASTAKQEQTDAVRTADCMHVCKQA